MYRQELVPHLLCVVNPTGKIKSANLRAWVIRKIEEASRLLSEAFDICNCFNMRDCSLSPVVVVLTEYYWGRLKQISKSAYGLCKNPTNSDMMAGQLERSRVVNVHNSWAEEKVGDLEYQ